MRPTHNVIFGSGLIGLLAKKLLPGDWSVIPFGMSRFYSFNPPLADNFISRDNGIDDRVRDILSSQAIHFYKRAYSIGGELLGDHTDAVCTQWLSKLFGDNVPGQALPYIKTRLTTPVYDLRANKLYERLQNTYHNELVASAANGHVTEVGDHYYICNNIRYDFDRAISTIPLSILSRLSGINLNLQARDEHFVLVQSNKIDLEGYNQAFVVDSVLDFYKVINMAKNLFMFCFLNDIPAPGAYLMPIIGDGDIIDGSCIRGSIPVGDIPDISCFEKMGIFCIGSLAQHDWCMDVGSCILRIIRYINRSE